MNPKDITQNLKKIGGVKRIAEICQVSPPAVSQVIHGSRPNIVIKEAIAEAIGKPINEVFPEATSQDAA